MNARQRDKVFQELHDDCSHIISTKGTDYASERDVLDNFKRNALKCGLEPTQIWQVYFSKHLDAIDNAIKRDPKRPVCTGEPLYGRIVDSINYLRLLACLCKEADEIHTTEQNEPLTFAKAVSIVNP